MVGWWLIVGSVVCRVRGGLGWALRPGLAGLGAVATALARGFRVRDGRSLACWRRWRSPLLAWLGLGCWAGPLVLGRALVFVAVYVLRAQGEWFVGLHSSRC